MAGFDADAEAVAKPEKDATTHIQLKVKDQHENLVFFKVKRTTPLDKLTAAHAQQRGIGPLSLRLFFDGIRIVPGHTPEKLEMEDGDMLNVFLEQHGGGLKLDKS